MSQRVLVSRADHIAYVTLNRPEKHNGIDAKMLEELIAAAKLIRRDRSIRCVILKGEGASFCAGLDFAAMTRKPSTIARFFLKWPWQKDNRFQRVAHIWRDLPMPVIAVLHGSCFGGGAQIALACDFRIAHPETEMALMEMKWGLVPDMSGMVTLSRLTRVDIASDLAMTGRRFSAQQAAEYGLVTQLSDTPLEAAKAMAAMLVAQSPDAVAGVKYLLKKSWKKDTRMALLFERWTQLRLLGRKNQKRAMANGLQKDKPKKSFADRSSFR